MLRRKLLLYLGPLVALLLAVTLVAVALLQSVQADMTHVNNETLVAVEQVNDLAASISSVELGLHELQASREQHLDPVIEEVEALHSRVEGLARFHIVRTKGAAAYARIKELLAEFEANVGALATTLDSDLVRLHSQKAIDLSIRLRQESVALSRIARNQAMAEEAALTVRFRRLVIGLTVAFLLVINATILVLVRTATMVLRPVERLVEASRQLALEQFDHRVRLSEKDEFDELAQAYNHLAEQLQASERRRIEMLGQVALTLNHEVNNAVGIIELQLSLLDRQGHNGPAADSLDKHFKCLRLIRENLQRMTRTVDALKHVRRIVLTDYLSGGGEKMLDLRQSVQGAAEGPGAGSEEVQVPHDQ